MLCLKKRARSRLLESFIILGLIAVAIHTGVNVLTVDGQAFGVFSPGVTGQVSLQDSLNNIKLKYKSLTMSSRIILFIEWALLVALVILAIVKRGVLSKREEIHINISRYGSQGKNGSNTEIDQLYKALQDKRALSVPTIAKAFKVKEETVMDWGKILENGNLAEIHYPWMGDPQIKIMYYEAEDEEKDKTQKDGEKEKDQKEKDNKERTRRKEESQEFSSEKEKDKGKKPLEKQEAGKTEKKTGERKEKPAKKKHKAGNNKHKSR